MRRGSRFFKHTITILEHKTVSNGMGGSTKRWEPINSFKAFMDTPSSQSVLVAHQMQKTLDRELYYPANEVIPAGTRIKYGDVEYEQVSEPIDQGGQGQFYCLQLKKVK